jgi:tetratricopeptide (TPR) repeat protein
VFQNCVTQEPLSAEARSSLARAYYEAGRIRNADEQARMALDLSPSLPSVYLTRSYFLHQLGRLDGAIEELERGGAAVVEGPVTRYKLATMYLNLGLLYQQKKDSERAEQALRRSLEIWPRAVGWYYAGEFYFDQGRYEEALEMFKLAWTNVPRRYAPIHLKLARTYDRLGDTEGARAGYEKYLELAPGSAESAEVSRRLAQL